MFLYFVSQLDPHRTRLPRHELPPEIAHAFTAAPVVRGVMAGPGGQAGLLCGETIPPGYYPDEQAWVALSDRCWLGWTKDKLPDPAELARPEQLDGHWVADDSGRRWLVPFAINWHADGTDVGWSQALPRKLAYRGTQWVPGEVKERYRRLWDLVQAYQQALAEAYLAQPDAERIAFAFEPIDELAVLALGTNYRVGPHELNALGAYDDHFRGQIIAAVRGLPLLDELKKKQAHATGGS